MGQKTHPYGFRLVYKALKQLTAGGFYGAISLGVGLPVPIGVGRKGDAVVIVWS